MAHRPSPVATLQASGYEQGSGYQPLGKRAHRGVLTVSQTGVAPFQKRYVMLADSNACTAVDHEKATISNPARTQEVIMATYENGQKERQHQNRVKARIRKASEVIDRELSDYAHATEPARKWWKKIPWLLRKATILVPYKLADGAANIIGYDLPDLITLAALIS